MAVNMTELDATIDKMLSPSQSRMQAFGESMSGSGPESLAAFKSLQSMAAGMVDVGARAAKTILELRANEELPRDFRLTRTNETRDAARLMLTKFNDGAHKAAGQIESALVTGLLPAPHRDPAQRLLIRDGLRTRYAHTDGERLVGAIVKRLGENQDHDAELLSSFGADFLEGAGITADQVDAIRKFATEAYLKRTDGSKQQVAARKALTAFRELNVVGSIAAYNQAGRMHLSKAD